MESYQNAPVHYVESKSCRAPNQVGSLLFEMLCSQQKDFQEVVFLCIGSDRITGDSLGPLIGHKLSKEHLSRCIIYGTLDQPVHALNLAEVTAMVHTKHPNCLLIAIDASLGSKRHQEFVTIRKGALAPGLGVKKKLPPVGDISITGIVNLSGAFEHFVLQTTRLATVIQLADTIVSGILIAIFRNTSFFFIGFFPFGFRFRTFSKLCKIYPSVCSIFGEFSERKPVICISIVLAKYFFHQVFHCVIDTSRKPYMKIILSDFTCSTVLIR